MRASSRCYAPCDPVSWLSRKVKHLNDQLHTTQAALKKLLENPVLRGEGIYSGLSLRDIRINKLLIENKQLNQSSLSLKFFSKCLIGIESHHTSLKKVSTKNMPYLRLTDDTIPLKKNLSFFIHHYTFMYLPICYLTLFFNYCFVDTDRFSDGTYTHRVLDATAPLEGGYCRCERGPRVSTYSFVFFS